ncbi:unnamed protein product [Calicophoron daubneyi]|uniref:DH domain-containing protein n=1 Tax=Calicophoron daubneyi TaxID=300641 RepID=A0AAV2T764_CALDB
MLEPRLPCATPVLWTGSVVTQFTHIGSTQPDHAMYTDGLNSKFPRSEHNNTNYGPAGLRETAPDLFHQLSSLQHQVRTLKRNELLMARRLSRVERQRQLVLAISQDQSTTAISAQRKVLPNMLTPTLVSPTSPSDSVALPLSLTCSMDGISESSKESTVIASTTGLGVQSENRKRFLRQKRHSTRRENGHRSQFHIKVDSTPQHSRPEKCTHPERIKKPSDQPPVGQPVRCRATCWASARTDSDVSSIAGDSDETRVQKSPESIGNRLKLENPMLLEEAGGDHETILCSPSSDIVDLERSDLPLSLSATSAPKTAYTPKIQEYEPTFVLNRLVSPQRAEYIATPSVVAIQGQLEKNIPNSKDRVEYAHPDGPNEATCTHLSPISTSAAAESTVIIKPTSLTDEKGTGLEQSSSFQRQNEQTSPSNETERIKEVIRRILEELVATERSYCHSLFVFSEVVAKTVCTKGGVSLKELRSLFPRSLPELYAMHMNILQKMERGMQGKASVLNYLHGRHSAGQDDVPFLVLLQILANHQPPSTRQLVLDGELTKQRGDNAVKLENHSFSTVEKTVTNKCSSAQPNSPFFMIYKQYLTEFTVAIVTMRKLLRQSSKFRQTLKRLRKHPDCDGFDFSAFLLAPVQRLPRYLLLVKQLTRQFRKLCSRPDVFVGNLRSSDALALSVYAESQLHAMLVYLDSQLAGHLQSPGVRPSRSAINRTKTVSDDPKYAASLTKRARPHITVTCTNAQSSTTEQCSKGLWPRVRRAFSEKHCGQPDLSSEASSNTENNHAPNCSVSPKTISEEHSVLHQTAEVEDNPNPPKESPEKHESTPLLVPEFVAPEILNSCTNRNGQSCRSHATVSCEQINMADEPYNSPDLNDVCGLQSTGRPAIRSQTMPSIRKNSLAKGVTCAIQLPSGTDRNRIISETPISVQVSEGTSPIIMVKDSEQPSQKTTVTRGSHGLSRAQTVSFSLCSASNSLNTLSVGNQNFVSSFQHSVESIGDNTESVKKLCITSPNYVDLRPTGDSDEDDGRSPEDLQRLGPKDLGQEKNLRSVISQNTNSDDEGRNSECQRNKSLERIGLEYQNEDDYWEEPVGDQDSNVEGLDNDGDDYERAFRQAGTTTPEEESSGADQKSIPNLNRKRGLNTNDGSAKSSSSWKFSLKRLFRRKPARKNKEYKRNRKKNRSSATSSEDRFDHIQHSPIVINNTANVNTTANTTQTTSSTLDDSVDQTPNCPSGQQPFEFGDVLRVPASEGVSRNQQPKFECTDGENCATDTRLPSTGESNVVDGGLDAALDCASLGDYVFLDETGNPCFDI